MSFDFDAASDQFLSAVAPVTTPPFTLAGWFNAVDDNTQQTIIALIEGGTNNHFFTMWADGDAATVNFRIDAGVSSESCHSSTSWSDNVWHHACAIAYATDSRAAFLNGGGKVTVSTDITAASIDELDIGATNRAAVAFECNGLLAEIGLWNLALTDAEVAVLAAGYSPLFVRPQNLVFYAPIVRELVDTVGGATITNNNTATVADHPRMIYPSPPSLVVPPAAAVAAIASQRLKIGVGR